MLRRKTTDAEVSNQNLIKDHQQKCDPQCNEQPEMTPTQLVFGVTFNEFWSPWCERIQRYCINQGFSYDDANDIEAIVSVKVWQKLPEFEFKGDAALKGWIYKITDNTIIDFRRRETVRQAVASLDKPIIHSNGSSTELAEIVPETYYTELVNKMRDIQFVLHVANKHKASEKQIALLKFLLIGDPLPKSLTDGKSAKQIRNWCDQTKGRLLKKLRMWIAHEMMV